MPPALVKLVALLLLVVQGAIASASGRVVCIPLLDCGQHHESTHECHHGGSDECAAEIKPVGCHDHEHGPFDRASPPGDGCSCHVHVPVPDQKQLPGNSRGDSQDPRSFIVPLVAAIIAARDFEPRRTVGVCLRPPDFSTSDQVRGLKATRLLI
jgi:hypothetical protein